MQKIRYLAIFLLSVICPVYSDPIDHAVVSVYAVNCKTGEVLLSENCDTSMTPASCMKIVTTGAALQLLHPNTRLQTRLEFDGYRDNHKTLHGNIYLLGGGDPCLGSDRVRHSSWKKQISLWADSIQNHEIERIQGKILVDTSKWESALAVPSWEWEDLGNYYGAGASALSFNENQYTISLKPAQKVGDEAILTETDPPLQSLTFYNEVKTGPADSEANVIIYGSEFSPLRFLRGTIPLGINEYKVKGAIPDPAALIVELLTQELQARNILVEEAELPPQNNQSTIHIMFSPSIREIVYETNHKSINLYAEHLLKILGEEVYHEGSTESGIKAVTDFWRSQEIDLEGFYMADGSGLSRKNLITTKQLVEILLKMKKSSAFSVFYASLPEIDTGVRAKSGTMSLVKGYAGYANGIAFAILVNQCPNSQVKMQKINALLTQIKELNTKKR